MAFKELQDLSADVTIRLGGIDKKTGKKNPTSVEGYYIGSRQVDSPKSKTGKAWLHFFSTAKGNTAVWGKTDMDKKVTSVPVGNMTRVTFTGMQATKNGEMYKYKVEQDDENVMEVASLNVRTFGASSVIDEDDSEDSFNQPFEEEFNDEETVAAPPPSRAPAAASGRSFKELLAKKSNAR